MYQHVPSRFILNFNLLRDSSLRVSNRVAVSANKDPASPDICLTSLMDGYSQMMM